MFIRLLLVFALCLPMIGQEDSGPAFSVVGHVLRPGKYKLLEKMHDADAIIKAGLRDGAEQERIAVVRGRERHIFNYRDFVPGKAGDNLLLEDRDVVYVP